MNTVTIEFGQINIEVPRNEVANYFVNNIFPKLKNDYARELKDTIDGYNAEETAEDKYFYIEAEFNNFYYFHLNVLMNLTYNLNHFPELKENAQFMAAHDEFFKYVDDNVKTFFLSTGSASAQIVFSFIEDDEDEE